MSVLQAFVLGIVQGLSEFIPISSSGHLTLVPFFFGWQEPTLAFVVAVHFGTLVAALYVFRDIIAGVARAAIGWKNAAEEDRRMLVLLVIATIPAVVAGAAFEGLVGDAVQSPVLVSLLLGVTGYWLMSAETISEQRQADPERRDDLREIDGFERADAVTIGIAQAVSILPGISRSGATIGMAMRRGITREAATRFSFIMSIPIIAGALIFELPKIAGEARVGGADEFLIGLITSGIAGFFAIRWFIGVVQRRGLRPFGMYCVLLMLAGLLTALARG